MDITCTVTPSEWCSQCKHLPELWGDYVGSAPLQPRALVSINDLQEYHFLKISPGKVSGKYSKKYEEGQVFFNSEMFNFMLPR